MCNDFHTVDTALKWKAIELILLIFFVVLYNQLSIMFRYKFPAEKSSTNIHNIQFDSLQLCWVNSLFVFLPFFKSCSSCVARYLTSCWISVWSTSRIIWNSWSGTRRRIVLLEPVDYLLIILSHPAQITSNSVDGLLSGTCHCADKQFLVLSNEIRKLSNANH